MRLTKWFRYLWCRHNNLSHKSLVDFDNGKFVWMECHDCLYARFYRIG